MKKNFLLILAFSAIIGCIVSCDKPEYVTPNTPNTKVTNNTITLAQFLDANKPAEQDFTLDATQGGLITGAKGTRISFPHSCFVDNNGKAITGNVDIKVMEILTKADMIFSGIFTNASNGDLLKSGGMAYIKVSQNGNDVKMAPGKFYTLSFPIPSTEIADKTMGIFFGQSASGNPVSWMSEKAGKQKGADSFTVYTDSLGRKDTVVYKGDSIYCNGINVTKLNNEYSYQTCLGDFNWINCDTKVGSGPYTHCHVKTSTDNNDSNAKIYLILNDSRSLIPLDMQGNHDFITTYANVSVGLKATMLAVRIDKTGFYSCISYFTVTPEIEVAVTLKTTTIADVVKSINGL